MNDYKQMFCKAADLGKKFRVKRARTKRALTELKAWYSALPIEIRTLAWGLLIRDAKGNPDVEIAKWIHASIAEALLAVYGVSLEAGNKNVKPVAPTIVARIEELLNDGQRVKNITPAEDATAREIIAAFEEARRPVT